MNCRECLEMLQQDLDGAPLASSEGLTSHLRECRNCAALYAASRRMVRALLLLTPQTPPPDLAGRIAAAARRSIRRRQFARRGAFVVALAAAVLVAIGTRYAFRPGAAPAPEIDVAKAISPPAVPHAAENPKPPPLRNAVAEVGDAVASLTTRTADEAMGQTRLLLPMMSRSSLADLDFAPREATTRPLRQAGQNVTAGLDPVANSARRAIDLFLRDIPPVGAPERHGL